MRQPELIIPGATGIHATNQIQVARGNWATATIYALADLVLDTVDSKYYVCVFAHTSVGGSGTDTDAPNTVSAYWRETVWTASAADLTTPATMVWNDAIDDCLALSYAGHDDWRLPSAFEAYSIVDLENKIDLEFENPQDGYSEYYWSSSTWKGNTANALATYHVSGFLYDRIKANAYYLRPVRGGVLHV